MKKNLGTIDKVVRILLAVVVAVLYFMGLISGTLAVILLIVAGVLILTSIVGICPLYMAFGMNTIPKK